MSKPYIATANTTPLTHTEIEISIKDLFAEHLVRHYYVNADETAIEAVFSFPIPLDAAFLGMTATLGGKSLTATIKAKHEAEVEYDDALSEGHSAVLLINPEPGMLCTSLGNLMPGESCEIEFRYMSMLRVADHMARFSLPLVHRPRYGHWALEDLETPTHDFAIEHPLSAAIRVDGFLAKSPVACSTHSVKFNRISDGIELTINHAMLDRDLVLTFDLSTGATSTGRLIEDADASLGLINFVVPPSQAKLQAMDVCVVIDCSGSMEGDAIAQCREAIHAIVNALDDTDRIQVLRFGSTIEPMFRRPLRANPIVRKAIHEMTSTINADLGGTEMGKALENAIKHFESIESKRSRSIILVTDGAVQPMDIEKAKSKANANDVRIFVIAVGSSAGVEVLKPLAESTQAVLERAVPGESIEVIVMRQFRRAKEHGPLKLIVDWNSEATEQIHTGVYYPGDAVLVAARILDNSNSKAVNIKALSHSGNLIFEESLQLSARNSAPAERSFLGQLRYQASPSSERERLALHYDLLTNETAAVMVLNRNTSESINELPTIIHIPQMISHGMVSISSPLIRNKCILVDMQLNSISHKASLIRSDRSLRADLIKYNLEKIIEPTFNNKINSSINACEVQFDSFQSVTPDRISALLVALYVKLRNALNNSDSEFVSLTNAISHMPDEDQAILKSIFIDCGLNAFDKRDALATMIALDTKFSHLLLSDTEEARVTLLLKFHSKSKNNSSAIITKSKRVLTKLSNIMSNGIMR